MERVAMRGDRPTLDTLKDNAMMNPGSPQTESQPRKNLNSKLAAALEYLGDKLCTHPASRFRPARRLLLDEWRVTRRLEPEGS